MGWPTVRAVYADRLVPGLLDRYLAAKGFRSQQADEPRPPDHGDNLYEPVAGDAGTRGRFDTIARDRSLLLDDRLAAGTAWSSIRGRLPTGRA